MRVARMSMMAFSEMRSPYVAGIVLRTPSGGRRPDDRGPQPGRNKIDDRDGDEDHQDQEGDLLPFVDLDLLVEARADATGADDTDDRRRAGVGFEIVQHLAQKHRQYLGKQPEAHPLHTASA